jgi:Mg-chelatase subunit ChlD
MPDLTAQQRQTLSRWRLVLGQAAEEHGISLDGSDPQMARIEALVGFLFEGGDGGAAGAAGKSSPSRGRTTGRGPGHTMTVPRWVDEVAQLFPREAKEVMERELVNRRGLKELLQSPELMERVEPNKELMKTLLTHRDLLNDKTRSLAKKIVEKVVKELQDKLKVQVEPVLIGAIRRDKHSPRRVVRNLDLKRTIRRNLHNYDAKTEKLLVDRLYFYGAEKKNRPWHICVVVDQSGSMLDSAIYSTVMAAIFARLPALRTNLVLYDTEVVDMSEHIRDPVDVLMNVQLGGGNDTPRALRYATQLVREPARSIVVLISDFYEGSLEGEMVKQIRDMAAAGIRMIGLGALGYDARPEYNKTAAAKCRKVGMDILSCTPERLAEAMARIIRG